MIDEEISKLSPTPCPAFYWMRVEHPFNFSGIKLRVGIILLLEALQFGGCILKSLAGKRRLNKSPKILITNAPGFRLFTSSKNNTSGFPGKAAAFHAPTSQWPLVLHSNPKSLEQTEICLPGRIKREMTQLTTLLARRSCAYLRNQKASLAPAWARDHAVPDTARLWPKPLPR